MSAALQVYMHERLAGQLKSDKQGTLVFQYDPRWLARHNATPISLSLPLQEAPFANGEAAAYFTNLLPEAEQHLALARRLKTDSNNTFRMLKAVAGECAGAVRLVAQTAKTTTKGSYRKLTDKTFYSSLKLLSQQPLLVGRKGVRLSLAGTHCKLPVLLEENAVPSVPVDGAPSNYIIKPPRDDFSDSVENEYFCMKLAARMGLDVPAVALLDKSMRVYAVERFDRITRKNGKIFRLHQEDFCQSLGILPENKYEKDGGPSFQQCFDLVRYFSIQPLVDMRSLLDWVVFNFLIGNEGIHAKNLSFYLGEEGPRLCPFYDLMSTAVYPSLSYRMVMKIGGEDRPNWLIKRRWQQFANDIGMNHKMVQQAILKMGKSLLKNAKAEAKDYYVLYGYSEIIDRIIGLIETRCQKMGRRLVVKPGAK